MWNDRYSNLFGAGMARGPMAIGATALTAAGSAVSAAGTIAGGNAAYDAGVRQQQAYEFRANQEDMAAQESRASQQRAALDKRREAELLLSKLGAKAAAGGSGGDDPGIIQLGEKIAARGEYESLLEMYKGENRARGLEDQAMASRLTGQAALAEGEAKRKASRLSAIGTIIGGAGSMFRMGSGGSFGSGAYG